MQYLIGAVDVVFKAALQFYRVRRGKGAKAIDVSSFFKRKNLHHEFLSFWRGSRNKFKGAFYKAINRFKHELKMSHR